MHRPLLCQEGEGDQGGRATQRAHRVDTAGGIRVLMGSHRSRRQVAPLRSMCGVWRGLEEKCWGRDQDGAKGEGTETPP